MTEDPVMLWVGLAVSLFGIVYGLRRTPHVRKLWARVPDDLKPFAPVAFGVTLSAVEAVASGRSLRQALAIAASAALTAQLAHHGLKAAPGRYGSRPPDVTPSGRVVRYGDAVSIPPASEAPTLPPPPSSAGGPS